MKVRSPFQVDPIARGCPRCILWGALRGLLWLPLVTGALACHSSQPHLDDPRSHDLAREATLSARWDEASRRWGSIFVAEGGEEACAQTARALLELGDARRAHDILVLGLEQEPRSAELLELDGHALADSGYRRAAESSYVRALEVEPDRVSALVALARVRADLGHEQSAIDPLERAIALEPEDVELKILYAEVTQRAGRSERAYLAWKQALQPGTGDEHELLLAAQLWCDPAVRTTFQDASQVCLGWLNRAVELDPQCSAAYFQIALICEDRGDLEAAVKAYRRAVELEPTSLRALTNLAVLYARMEDERGVREMVARALELEDDPSRRAELERLLAAFEEEN